MRRPWNRDPEGAKTFRFDEKVRRGDRQGYLWGNAAYAFGEVVMRTLRPRPAGWPIFEVSVARVMAMGWSVAFRQTRLVPKNPE